ncbi:MAG: (2Fe-2S) ferredoxin domain-containing protein [Methylococcaceae bacterium]
MSEVAFYVCTNRRLSTVNPSCGARGSEELLQQLQIATHELNISVEEICCLGHCADGMVVKISPSGTFYHHVTELDIPTLIARYTS